MRTAFKILPLVGVLLLGGCAELLATAIEDGRLLHESAKGYVAAVHEARREVRRLCWEMLVKEVDALEDAGRYSEARALLKVNYPGLVSVTVIKKVLDKEQVAGAEPFGCDDALDFIGNAKPIPSP